jgi:TrmH family RNA methyltransferase
MPHAIRFVFLRPRSAENLGAIARGLKNFGFDDWVVVDAMAEDENAAKRLAVQSHDVLSRMKRASSLDEAIADCVWVVGTSSRRRRGRQRLSAREAGALAWERSEAGTVAMVFGDERSGLTNEELDRCHSVSTLPSSDAQPSVNLAQALLLYAYEVRMAAMASGGKASAARPKAATDGEVTHAKEALWEALRLGRFLTDDGRDAPRALGAVLDRALMTRKEAALWVAAMRSVAKRLK